MILFFDTETTGKADFRSPPDAPHQPRLVQFGALFCGELGEEISSVSLIVKPNGYTIPDDVAAIHGITNAKAESCGVNCTTARDIYESWWNLSSLVVAHNINFDLRIMDGEMDRSDHGSERLRGPKNKFCTMAAMTPICKLPGNYGDYKWPKLQEAYKHAFGSEFDGAHDAMADVRACAKIYFWLKAQKGEAPK